MNEEAFDLGITPQEIGGEIYVPLNAMAKATGASIYFENGVIMVSTVEKTLDDGLAAQVKTLLTK